VTLVLFQIQEIHWRKGWKKTHSLAYQKNCNLHDNKIHSDFKDTLYKNKWKALLLSWTDTCKWYCSINLE